MKRLCRVGLLVYSLSVSELLNAQYYYYDNRYYEPAIVMELGVGTGIMNAMTDLGGRKGIGKGFIKDLVWRDARPSAGIYLLAIYRNALGLRLEGTGGRVAAADRILRDVRTTTFGRYERNLSFRSDIMELQLALEVHPVYFRDYGYDEPPRLSPYLILGTGYFMFGPKAKLDGQWYSLQPLRTEGQGFAEHPGRKPYRLGQFNFSGGAGIRYEISSLISARIELDHRLLLTDYLDDVSTSYIDPKLFDHYLPRHPAGIATRLYSRMRELDPDAITKPGEQRGDPGDNDAFFTIQVKIGVALGRRKRI